MNRRLSPNRFLTRSWSRTVRAIAVFPIPPAPMRAMDARFSERPTIFSINSSRPKKDLGAGGGSSPGTLAGSVMDWVHKQVGSLTQFEPCYSLGNQQLWLEYHRRDQARPWYFLRFLSVPLSRCDRVSLGACLRSVPRPCRGFNKESNRGRNRLTRLQHRFVLAAIQWLHPHHPHLGPTCLTPSTRYQPSPSLWTTPTVRSDERLV